MKDIFRGQGLVCVRLQVCESHTLTYLVYCRHLYIAVGNAGRQSSRFKISSHGHLSVSHKDGNTRAGRAAMEGTGRKERGKGGIDHTAS